ncbi:hypothetical protein D3C79_805650 [compost metagenome]
MEQVEKLPGRVAVVADSLLRIESRQRRVCTHKAKQVQPQARTLLAALVEKLHSVDVAPGKPQAGVGFEFQPLV